MICKAKFSGLCQAPNYGAVLQGPLAFLVLAAVLCCCQHRLIKLHMIRAIHPPSASACASSAAAWLVLNDQVHGCRPRMDSKLNTITFAYTILQGNSLPNMSGTANTVAAGNSMNVLPYITPGSTL